MSAPREEQELAARREREAAAQREREIAGRDGREAADEVKGFFKGIHDAGEVVRNDINSFGDNFVGELQGHKSHQSTGFSKDARAVGREVDQEFTGTGTTANENAGTTKKTNA